MNRPGQRTLHRKQRTTRAKDLFFHRKRDVSLFLQKLFLENKLVVFAALATLVLCYVLLRGQTVGERSGESVWTVSISRVDITPKELVWLSGFSSRNRTAESTQPLLPDFPLFARAIAIRNQTGRAKSLPLVVVSLDVIGFDHKFSASVLREVEREFGISRDRLRLCATHTHSGPVVRGNLAPLMPPDEKEQQKVARYTEWLTKAVLQVIRGCVEGRQETVSMSFAEVTVPLATNRRQVVEAEFHGERGTTEDRVPIMWFAKGSRVVAGLFGVAAHATILTSSYRYSGDYPGYAVKNLQDQTGGMWLFLAGCGGDQNIYPRGSLQMLQHHGSNLVNSILRAIRDGGTEVRSAAVATDAYIDLHFARRYSAYELAIRARSKNAVEKRSADLLQTKGIGTDGKTKAMYPFPLGVWRLGDVRIVFLGGEPTVGYCHDMKKAGATWIVGYCQDVMGYVGTADVIREGGREGGERAAWYYGLPSAWSADTERRIMNSAHSMLTNLNI
ncbi:unnamed protein product [Agarophyton chilense]|eukprot:gb/GEZJ01004670.1/.p1 GENE.gb/GEZJ01004670.1/~~gb/GEZJ01004670.1/.p1  ORF type:complete len:502 (-),score=34.28 gb/GEZJ01004670.1/:354-1859(-)